MRCVFICRLKQLRFKDIGKEPFQLEMPASVKPPDEYALMSCTKTVRRYWTPFIKAKVKAFQIENDKLQSTP